MRKLIGSISLALITACSGGEDPGACPDNSTAAQAAGQAVVNSKCVTCHSSALTGAARQDAPTNLNFDNLTTVRSEADDMFGEANSGDMPPTGKLSAEDLANLKAWLACGAPNTGS